MTFVVKQRGGRSSFTLAEYMCPEHGRFDALVERDENGDPPSAIGCPTNISEDEPSGLPAPNQGRCSRCNHFGLIHGAGKCHAIDAWEGDSPNPPDISYYCKCDGFHVPCAELSPWTISAPSVHTQFVVSATQGKSASKPHNDAMDTRMLAEGRRNDFRKQRKAVKEKRRQQRLKALLE